jgi:hypothetical protein
MSFIMRQTPGTRVHSHEVTTNLRELTFSCLGAHICASLTLEAPYKPVHQGIRGNRRTGIRTTLRGGAWEGR